MKAIEMHIDVAASNISTLFYCSGSVYLSSAGLNMVKCEQLTVQLTSFGVSY